jgi:hypothetical protein
VDWVSCGVDTIAHVRGTVRDWFVGGCARDPRRDVWRASRRRGRRSRIVVTSRARNDEMMMTLHVFVVVCRLECSMRSRARCFIFSVLQYVY